MFQIELFLRDMQRKCKKTLDRSNSTKTVSERERKLLSGEQSSGNGRKEITLLCRN